MRADYHIHSNFSVDSKLEMEEIIQQAINLGLDEICFTDHVDYDVKNHRYYLSASNSDGAGGYEVVWVFTKEELT